MLKSLERFGRRKGCVKERSNWVRPFMICNLSFEGFLNRNMSGEIVKQDCSIRCEDGPEGRDPEAGRLLRKDIYVCLN